MPSMWGKTAIVSQIITAVSAAAIAGLAIYGVFFTDLPERLVTQLRSEIAEAKSESTELRLRNRSLVAEGNELAAENSVIQTEVDLRKQELKNLSAMKKSLEHELERIRNERTSYFNETARVILKIFFTELSNRLSELEIRAVRARDIPDAEKLLQYDQETTSIGFWLQQIPKSWRVWPFYLGLDREMIENFKKEITLSSGNVPITAFQMVSRKLNSAKFSNILPDDRKRLFETITSYMQANNPDFSAPLEIAMPRGWTYEDLPSAYSRVSRAQRRIKQHLAALEVQITP